MFLQATPTPVDWTAMGSQAQAGFQTAITGLSPALIQIALVIGGVSLLFGFIKTFTGWKG